MSEEQAQQLLYQMQILESFAANLDQKEAAIVNILREAISSIDTIKGTQNQEAESLVPVGLGTYVKAMIQGNSKIVVDVGAGIAIEKDHDSAINYLESRIKELQVALNETNAQKHETMLRLEQLKEQMNHLMQPSNPSKQ
jgi:prefoldin alpha subunit